MAQTSLLVGVLVLAQVFATSSLAEPGATTGAAARPAAARAQPPTADEVAEMRRLATDAATKGRGHLSGTTGPAAPGVNPLQAHGRQLLDSMGVVGVETLAQPALDQGASARTVMRGAVDFSCAAPAGQRRSSRGAEVRFQGCTGAGPDVQVAVDVCVGPLFRPESCGDAGFVPMSLRSGAYSAGPEGVQFGLGCNLARVCTVSFTASLVAGGTGAALTQQASAQYAQAQGADRSLVSGIARVYNSAEYTEAQRAPADAPPVVQALERAASGSAGSHCTLTADCLRTATTERRFTKTCDRSFLLTERTEQFALGSDRVLTCTQERGGGPTGGSVETVFRDSCQTLETVDVGDSTTITRVLVDSRAGMVEVGRRLVSTCQAGGTEATCQHDTYDTYYAAVDTYTRTGVGYNPLALSTTSPVCDERPDAKTTTCPDPANWFGRTLSAAECAVPLDVDGQVVVSFLDYTQKPGCGVCTSKSTITTCYGEPTQQQPEDSCASVDLQGCTEASVAPLTFSGENAGLVTSQRVTYNCTRATQVCSEYAARNEQGQPCTVTDPGVAANTFGIENVAVEPEPDGGFAQAAADLAVVGEVVQGIQDAGGDQAQLMPRLFSGKDRRCSSPTSSLLGVGGLLSRQCCRADLERPKKGSLGQDGCGDEEVELSASRRQHYTHFVGEYCDRKGLFGKCLVKRQSHCAYPGLFPRLIAEQGREQLNALAASGAAPNTRTAPLEYGFYSTSDSGGWTTPIEVNGVRVAAYQWPRVCADPAQVAQRQAANPSAPDCPGVLTTWVAGCDAADCGALPASPWLAGSGWAVAYIDPLAHLTVPVSRYAVVRGACDTATARCAYTVSAWPTGQGGKVIVSRDLSFPLWDSSPPAAGTAGTGVGLATRTTVSGQQQNVSGLFFRPYPHAGMPSALPATVRIDFSTAGGTAGWTTMNVPTTLPEELEIAGTDFRISGSCDAMLNACRYRLVGTATIETKGWGSPRSPDCTGFTAGQVAAMDFSKLDLSEWLDDVMAKKGSGSGNAPARLAETATRQAAAATPNAGGKVASPTRAPAPYAMATPAESYGPFTATLAAGGWWPYSPAAGARDAERVVSVTVRWGDCSAAEALPVVSAINGQPTHGFRGQHRYLAPNDAAYASCHPAAQAANASIDHAVELVVKTESGRTHTTALSVRNVWSRYQGAPKNIAPGS